MVKGRNIFFGLVLWLGAAYAETLWQDHKKLRLVCFWKAVNTEKEAVDPRFPTVNRKDAPYQSQNIMGHADISASFFIQVAPNAELMAQSLLENDGRDLALITTRLGLKDVGKGFGDNHDVPRNTSGQNFVRLAGKYIAYSCGVYELPLPAQPRLNPGLVPRIPPIQ